MIKGSAFAATALTCLLVVGPATAAHRVHHGARHRVHHHHWSRLETNRLGDVIVTGGSGFHRSDVGVMVPDSVGPNFIESGRMSRSGVGGADGISGNDLTNR